MEVLQRSRTPLGRGKLKTSMISPGRDVDLEGRAGWRLQIPSEGCQLSRVYG